MIRTAKLKDVDTLVYLRRIFCKEDGHECKNSKKLFSEIISSKTLGIVFVYEQNRIIIGYAILIKTYSLEFYGRDALLDELFIMSDFRGDGIGSKLLAWVIKYAKKLKLTYLHLETMDTNSRAFGYYQKKGFRTRKSSHLVLPLKKSLPYPVCS